MNCKESLQKLYEFLDGEMEKMSSAQIEQHLDWCRGCWDRFEFEKRLKERLKKSCSKESCSDTLRNRIKSLLEKY